MKLATSYSLSTGLKLNEPFLYESYFPIPFSKFIVIHNGGGSFDNNGNPVFTSKLYSHYQEAIDLIKGELDKNEIKIIQVGTGKDVLISGALDLRDKTNIHQTKYLIRNSLLFVGNDSVNAHICGSLGQKMVVLYGGTSVANHSPYWYNPEISIFLESHRNGNKPSFSFQENPRTINFIKPEQVASSILKLLEIPYQPQISTIFLDENYHNSAVEIVPDAVIQPTFFNVCTIRGDLYFNDRNIYAQTQLCKSVIVIDEPLDVEILKKLKQNIAAICLKIDKFPDIVNYIKSLQKAGIPYTLITDIVDENELNKHKLKLYEFGVIIPQKTKFELPVEIKEKMGYSYLRVKSKCMMLASGKIYLSESHWRQNLVTENLTNLEGKPLDNEDFLRNFNRFWWYLKNE